MKYYLERRKLWTTKYKKLTVSVSAKRYFISMESTVIGDKEKILYNYVQGS
jgi:hypothetical protein